MELLGVHPGRDSPSRRVTRSVGCAILDAMSETRHGTVTLEIEDGIGVIRIDNPPVNALSAEVLIGLRSAFDRAQAAPEVNAVVLTGNSQTFVAGADVSRLQKIADGAPLDTPGVPRLPELCASIESSAKPSVAAIDGFALGGGLELALACQGRVGSTRCRVGLPELALGLIPGAGGTQRLPRLTGVEAAIELMLSSRQAQADEALRLGIVDAIASSDTLTAEACRLARELADGRRVRSETLARDDRLESAAAQSEIMARARAGVAKKYRNVTHPSACLDAIEYGLEHGGLAGLERERELFVAALASEPARAMLHLFFAERTSGKLPDGIEAGARARKLERIAVIGGGTMGSGIAAALLDAGRTVSLVETETERAEGARARIEKIFQSKVDKGRLSAELAGERLAALTTLVGLEGAATAELVIEAASESVELKSRLFAELARLVPSDSWLATNTSTIDVTILADASGTPERVLGLHFFSPAHVMKLVEVVRTPRTDGRALAEAVALIRSLKKTAVIVGNCPGFLVNRIFMPYSQLTGFLIDRGVDPYRIDRALVGFGMPMGPSRMSDLAGLDVGVAAGGILDAAYPERSYRSPLRRLLVEAGRLGEKTGLGHYRHAGGRAEEDPDLAEFVQRARELAGSPPALEISEQEIQRLLLFGVVNEACRAVEEGIVLRPSDVDVAATLGMGFPAYRGGPLRWADFIGAAAVHAALSEWRERFDAPIFEPAAYLTDCARAQRPLL